MCFIYPVCIRICLKQLCYVIWYLLDIRFQFYPSTKNKYQYGFFTNQSFFNDLILILNRKCFCNIVPFSLLAHFFWSSTNPFFLQSSVLPNPLVSLLEKLESCSSQLVASSIFRSSNLCLYSQIPKDYTNLLLSVLLNCKQGILIYFYNLDIFQV